MVAMERAETISGSSRESSRSALRIRYKLTVHARRERLLLAEEAALVALDSNAVIGSGSEARNPT